MSYEGREQHICENGHLFQIDCRFSYYESEVNCPHCSGHSAWSNDIDDTNGECMGEILQEEFDKLLISPAKYETCNLGHNHLVSQAVYRIPNKDELRQSFLSEGNVYYAIEDYNKYYGIQKKSTN